MFHFIRWNVLFELGKSRLVRSSYIWLIATPFLAQMLSAMDDPIELAGIGKGVRISLTLPFSWKAFYFSATAFAISGLVYLFRCPLILRRANSYAEFKSKMYDRGMLQDWVEFHHYDKRNAEAKQIFDGAPNALRARAILASTSV